MVTRRSAGLLLFRRRPQLEVLIAHMGGPLWARRDEGAWSVPKGELDVGEEPEAAARREFAEELGLPVPEGPLLDLGAVRQSGGKQVTVWALEADLDPAAVVPGTFEMEWPPHCGRRQQFPEVDRVAWCGPEEARRLLVTAQRAFVDRLVDRLAEDG